MPRAIALAILLSVAFHQTDSTAFLAQEVATPSAPAISGTVQDPSGAVVPNARVLIASQNAAQNQETVTDSSGTFRFDKLAPGSYRVSIQASGFKEESVSVKLAAKRIPLLRITLVLATQQETLTVAGADSSLS